MLDFRNPQDGTMNTPTADHVISLAAILRTQWNLHNSEIWEFLFRISFVLSLQFMESNRFFFLPET